MRQRPVGDTGVRTAVESTRSRCMQHDDFIGHVQHRADLDSRGAAEEATRAVLETLAERLGGGEPSDVAAQLPPELGQHLRKVEQEYRQGQRFAPHEFIERVREKSVRTVDGQQAAHETHAVLSVVRDAVAPGEWRDVADQLPEGYLEAFGLA